MPWTWTRRTSTRSSLPAADFLPAAVFLSAVEAVRAAVALLLGFRLGVRIVRDCRRHRLSFVAKLILLHHHAKRAYTTSGALLARANRQLCELTIFQGRLFPRLVAAWNATVSREPSCGVVMRAGTHPRRHHAALVRRAPRSPPANNPHPASGSATRNARRFELSPIHHITYASTASGCTLKLSGTRSAMATSMSAPARHLRFVGPTSLVRKTRPAAPCTCGSARPAHASATRNPSSCACRRRCPRPPMT